MGGFRVNSACLSLKKILAFEDFPSPIGYTCPKKGQKLQFSIMTENSETQDLSNPPPLSQFEDRVRDLMGKMNEAGILKRFYDQDEHKKYPKQSRFTDEAKMLYLAALATCGRKGDAAAAAGVTPKTVISHRKEDEEFKEAEEIAFEHYRDKIRKAIDEEGVEGKLKPIILKDSEGAQHIAGYERVRDMRALALAAKTLPEIKDRVEHSGKVDVHVGPLGVAPPPASDEDFEAEFGGPQLDPSRIKRVENTATEEKEKE